MPLITPKKLTPPTLDERAASAAATTEAALLVFARAADDLDKAAEELDLVAAEALAEADNLAITARDADEAARRNRGRANTIRSQFTF